MADAGITKWYGREVFTEATEHNIKLMHIAALLVESDVKKHFTLLGSGRTYKRKGIEHQASRPNEPPAIDTGVLRASIMSKVFTASGNVIGQVGPDVELIEAKTEMGTDVNYGLYLEMGTYKMQPRPFMRPALRRRHKQINKIFKDGNK